MNLVDRPPGRERPGPRRDVREVLTNEQVDKVQIAKKRHALKPQLTEVNVTVLVAAAQPVVASAAVSGPAIAAPVPAFVVKAPLLETFKAISMQFAFGTLL
ncbi:hypothetical protein BFJ72_g15404 [Fusarium proliferatum]|uniref:Uncharacterized protein n=1 Tax=Gibberella intermedia TaxID=948311 RepID=A0A420R9B8_GIBIN|nr:hypothetical protein BFJ72_g15404 [Fusarium proliferatum]